MRRIWATSRRWTPQVAQEALQALDDSGASLAAFAQGEGISAERLYRWRSRLGRQTALGFVEVAAATVSEGGDGVMEIVVTSGTLVRVSPDFNALALRRLLAVLRDEPC